MSESAPPSKSPSEVASSDKPDAPSDYDEMSKKITHHNLLVDDLKRRISALTARCPITCVEQQELSCLQSCLQREMRSLNALIQLAICKQSEQPDQKWGALPMSTSLEEDQLPHIMFYPPESFKAAPPPPPPKPSKSDKVPATKSKSDEKATAVAEASVSSSSATAAGAVEPDVDHQQLQADIQYRDMMIECLQQKMRTLRDEMQKICAVAKRGPPCLPCGGGGGKKAAAHSSPFARVQKKICCPVAAANQMQENALAAGCMQEQLEQMTQVLNQLQLELCSVQTERAELGKYATAAAASTSSSLGGGGARRCPAMPCVGIPCSSMPGASDELRNQHNTLLAEYAKKDRECAYLRERVASLDAAANNSKAGGGAESLEKVQIDILNKRIGELRDEEEEFQQLLADQQQQIGEYRAKFLGAQQQVVEQRTCIDGLELSKAQIEEQINGEVQRIKARFQEKLRELAPLPKLLEAERFRSDTQRQENEDLVAQMQAMTAQLRKARKDVKRLGNNGQAGGDAKRAGGAEMQALRRTQEQLELEKRDLGAQLQLCRDELQALRCDAQRAMQRTKERSDCSKETMQARIDRLEIELAETRAKAALKLADRDEVIQQMQDQLQELSANFGNAQKQIRGLKKRMTGLTESDVRDNCCC